MVRDFICITAAAVVLLAPVAAIAQDAAANAAQFVSQTALPPGVKRSDTRVFGNWTVICEEREEAPAGRRCTAGLHLAQQGVPQPVFSLIVGPDAKGAAQLSFVTPTGVKIAPGVEAKFGKGGARKIVFSACDSRCQADVPAGDAVLKDLRESDNVSATIVNLRGDAVTFTAPTAGAGAALDATKR